MTFLIFALGRGLVWDDVSSMIGIYEKDWCTFMYTQIAFLS